MRAITEDLEPSHDEGISEAKWVSLGELEMKGENTGMILRTFAPLKTHVSMSVVTWANLQNSKAGRGDLETQGKVSNFYIHGQKMNFL